MKLSPDDVLVARPRARLIALGPDRVWVEHATGTRVIRGSRAEDLQRLLDLLDGRRTAQEVVDALSEDFEAEGVVRTLRTLAGLGVVRRVEPGSKGEESGWRVTSLGEPDEADRWRAGLGAPDEPPEGSPELVLVGNASHGEAFRYQRKLLQAGTPSVFVAEDPDGLRVGPWTVPGAGAAQGPCWACARLGRLSAGTGESPARLFEALEDAAVSLRDAKTAATNFSEMPAEAVAELRGLLDPSEPPRLWGRVLEIPARGAPRRRQVTRLADCPVCGEIEPVDDAADPFGLAQRARAAFVEARGKRLATIRDRNQPPSVGILGGGTAGWLAALALRKKRPEIPVTLIESSAVPVIGVGEATTPLTPQFLHADLGLDARELFRRVRPTLKLGIRFLWGRPGDGAFNYPFGPQRPLEPAVWDGDVEAASWRSLLMTAGKVPVLSNPSGTIHSRLGTEVAYHLDNAPFVEWLREKGERAGVQRIDARVVDVEVGETSEGAPRVDALIAEDGRRFVHDLWIDASGFRSLLLENAVGSPFVSFADSLFTDRAVVGKAPMDGPVPPYTQAETWNAGWCWSTPQRTEDHKGYVFSSAFLSDAEAEAEMRSAVPGLGETRVLRFRAGRHGDFVRGNVAALGNAYGFVEPLESTAIHLLIRQIGLLVDWLPWRPEERGRIELLNRKVNGFWDYVRWFLAIHYRFNRRLDTPFWRTCREDVDVSAWSELLEAFRERGPLSQQPSLAHLFDPPDPLWGAEGVDLILLGQGVKSNLPEPPRSREEHGRWVSEAKDLVDRALTHDEMLQLLDERPDLLNALESGFWKVGSAFPAL